MKIIAHRGASGQYPENTLTAFEQAIIQQADGIELDIQYHPNGQWYVFHDYHVDKLTAATGLLTELSHEQIKQLQLPCNEKIPTLSEALAHIAGRCLVNLEIKISTVNTAALTQALSQLAEQITLAVEQYSFKRQNFIISSFNHPCIQLTQRLISQVRTAALIAHYPINFESTISTLDIFSLNPAICCLNQTIIKNAHNKKLEVWVYTVDQADDIARCYQWGVDAIFTNFPSRARKQLAKEPKPSLQNGLIY